MNKTEAIKAMRHGVIAATIQGLIAFIIVILAMFDNNEALSYWNDPTIFIDIAIIFACAVGLYKKSRTAAVILFIYYILTVIYKYVEAGKIHGVVIPLIFIYIYAKAMQGAFIYNKLEKLENPHRKPTSKLYYYIGIPLAILTFLLLGISFMTMTGILPSTEVQAGSRVLKSDKNLLITNNLITQNNKIEYFYSPGFTSILEEGSILTDKKLILYITDDNNKIIINRINFNDITSVELLKVGSTFEDSV